MTDKPGLSPALLRYTTISLACGLILLRVIVNWNDWTVHGFAGFGIAVFSGFLAGLPMISKMYGHVDIDELPALFREALDARGLGFPAPPPLPPVDKVAESTTNPTGQ